MAVSSNVDFYQKVKDLQDIQHERERERMQLDAQLNSFMKIDNRLERLKAARLQSYWKKISEDEKKSQWRNEQLMRDLERVESHMAALAAKTDRLRTLKQQYETYIEQSYPNWKEKITEQQQNKQAAAEVTRQLQLQRQQQQQDGPVFSFTVPSSFTHLHPAQQCPPHSGQSQQSAGQGAPSSPQQHRPVSMTPGTALPETGGGPPHQSRSVTFIQTPRSDSHQTQEQATPRNTGNKQPPAADRHVQPLASTAGSTLQTVSSLPTSNWLSTAPDTQSHLEESVSAATAAAIRVADRHQTASHNVDVVVDNLNKQQSVPAAVNQENDGSPEHNDRTMTRSQLDHTPSRPPISIPGAEGTMIPDYDDEFSEISLPSGRQDQSPTRSVPEAPAGVSSVTAEGTMIPDYDDEFSEISLPSGRQDQSPTRSVPEAPAGVSSVTGQRSPITPATVSDGVTPIEDVITACHLSSPDQGPSQPAVPQPDVTVTGFGNLLAAIEQNFPSCTNPDEYYSILTPALSVKHNIIEAANRGDTLSHLDTTSVSMVALNQLPLLVINSEEGCLIPDQALQNASHMTSEEVIRPHVHPTALTLWNALMDHFVKMMSYNIMGPHKIADTFAPHFIAVDSQYEDRAKALLSTVLQNMPNEDTLMSPNTTTTFNEMPVTPKPQIPHQVPKDIPPLDLGIERSTSFTEKQQTDIPETLQQSSNMPLTQTAAYRALLGGTQQTVTSSQHQEDSDDDVEQQLGSMVTSPRQQKKDGVQDKVPAAEQVKLSSQQSSPAKSSGVVQSVSPAPSSPSPNQSPTGYIPTGLENTGKTTTSFNSTGKSSKNPAFMYADSDLDDDIDLPGLGKNATTSLKHGQEKDDFDFYD